MVLFFVLCIAFLLFVFTNWLVVYRILRIDRPETYYLEKVMIKKEFHLFPHSWNYAYPEGHDSHNGFGVDWLWFNFSFLVHNRIG